MSSIKQIEATLRKASKAYYAGEPIMTDAEFDALLDLLRKQEPSNSFLSEIGAPVLKGQKAAHSMPMGSLRKAADWGDFDTFAAGITHFLIMPKFDGLSCELVYKGGKLVKALTRGDGLTGEVITDNVRKMKNVHEQLPLCVDVTLRGEILLDRDIFCAKYAAKYANPRNTAVGIARRHDGTGSEDLEIQYFAVQTIRPFKSRSQQLEWLASDLKLQLCYWKDCSSVHEAREYFEQTSIQRADFRWEMDGVVVSVDKFAERAVGDPMWPSDQIAIKFSADTSRSAVIDIEWEAGRTGRVNPTILVKPVLVNGVTIQRATGNNYGWMKEKNIGIGAEVLISRRGDVIPAVEEVLKTGTTLIAPTECPACNSPLVAEGAYLMCDNALCPAKCLGLMKHWVEMADIQGLGDASLRDLINEGIDMPDKLFITSLPTFVQILGENGRKVFKEIAAKSTMPLENIFAAFIPNVGTRRFQQLIRAGYNTPHRLLALTTDDLISVRGFDAIMAARILEGIEYRKGDIERILKYVEVKKVVKKAGNKLAGFGIKFTGKMAQDRNSMEEMAQEAGAMIGWNSSLTNVLVIADLSSTSTKAKTARAKGYDLWTPEQFLASL